MMMNEKEEDVLFSPEVLLSMFRQLSNDCTVCEYWKHAKDVATRIVQRGWDVERFVDVVLHDAWTLYPLQVLAACDDWTKADPGDGCALEDIIRHAARSALVADLRDRMEQQLTQPDGH